MSLNQLEYVRTNFVNSSKIYNKKPTDTCAVNIVIPLVDENSDISVADKKIPKQLNKQLEIVFKNAKIQLEDIPFWLKILGFGALKNDMNTLLDKQEFKEQLLKIFESAQKSGDSDKNVYELIKDEKVAKEVYSCVKANSPSKRLTNFMDFKIIENKFYDAVSKNKHRCLLYGEEK